MSEVALPRFCDALRAPCRLLSEVLIPCFFDRGKKQMVEIRSTKLGFIELMNTPHIVAFSSGMKAEELAFEFF